MQVEQILATKDLDNIITLTSNADIKTALKLLHKHDIGAVLITNEAGKVEGILSERDIVRTMAKHNSTSLTHPISQIMTTQVKTCKLTDQADAVLDKMTKGRFRHLPVMDEGKLCGIISIGDVVKTRLFEMEQENKALTDIVTV